MGGFGGGSGGAELPVERGGVGAAAQLQQPQAAVCVEEAQEGPAARRRGQQRPGGAEGGAAHLALVGVDGHRGHRRAGSRAAQVLKGDGKDMGLPVPLRHLPVPFQDLPVPL